MIDYLKSGSILSYLVFAIESVLIIFYYGIKQYKKIVKSIAKEMPRTIETEKVEAVIVSTNKGLLYYDESKDKFTTVQPAYAKCKLESGTIVNASMTSRDAYNGRFYIGEQVELVKKGEDYSLFK